jgi:hypothetical protein|tara:strand:+ start:180 stop:806 length:627 start_codon:yes stop_codon:yes gene_type:complete
MGFFSKIFGGEESQKTSILSNKETQVFLQESVKLMSVYLVASYLPISLAEKLKVKKKRTGKERYYLSICFLFGMHASKLDELMNNLDEKAPEYMQSIVHMFHLSVPEKMKKSIFKGIDFEPNKEGGFSKQNAEVCKWYVKKKIRPLPGDNFHKVKITGNHVMHLHIKKKLSPKETKMYEKMGSYLKNKLNPPMVLSAIFEDEKTKFKF